MERLKKEQEEKEHKKKEKAEAHLYTIIKVARDEDLAEQIGKDIYFDLVDHDKVRSFRVQKQMLFSLFKEEVAKEFGLPVQFQRFWLWAKRLNHTYRPYRPLSHMKEMQSVGQLREVSNKVHNAELKLFLEVEFGMDLRPIAPPERTKDDILLFFKLYDPEKEELRYVGRCFVKSTGKPSEILTRLNEMAGYSPDEEIVLYEEIKFEPNVMCDPIDKKVTFRASLLEDGDIICFQKASAIDSKERFRYPDVPSYLEYVHVHNRQVAHFRSLEIPKVDADNEDQTIESQLRVATPEGPLSKEDVDKPSKGQEEEREKEIASSPNAEAPKENPEDTLAVQNPNLEDPTASPLKDIAKTQKASSPFPKATGFSGTSSKSVTVYHAKDLDDCLNDLDENPFLILDVLSGEVSLSSAHSEATVQDPLGSKDSPDLVLQNFRKLIFEKPIIKEIQKDPSYKVEIESYFEYFEKKNSLFSEAQQEWIKDFTNLYQNSIGTIDQIKKTKSKLVIQKTDQAELIEKMQDSKVKVIKYDKNIQQGSSRIEDLKTEDLRLENLIKKYQEELEQTRKARSDLEEMLAKQRSFRNEILPFVRGISKDVVQICKEIGNLEKIVQSLQHSLEDFSKDFAKMQNEAPF